MSTTIYTVDLGFDEVKIKADLANAAAPILRQSHDFWIGTGYQTADARHDITRAAVLIIGTFDDQYWIAPDTKLEKSEDGDWLFDGLDQDNYIERLIVSIEENNEESKDGY
jgi:hypothetical protein